MTSDKEIYAVEFIRRAYKELSDGTLEIRIHVEPYNKEKFLRLFPDIDMPGAATPLRTNRRDK
jgi:hypothetical protein